jgi:two-component system response regulator NreC
VPSHVPVAAAADDSSPVPRTGPSIRVVLADGNALMRRRLQLVLDDEGGVEVVAEAGDLATAMGHVHNHQPHVLVIDLNMSNGTSIEAIRELRERVPCAQIVVLTMESNTVFAQEVLDAGAIGFVLKQAADAELAQGVRSAARGQQYVSPGVAARLASRRQSSGGACLSSREPKVPE